MCFYPTDYRLTQADRNMLDDMLLSKSIYHINQSIYTALKILKIIKSPKRIDVRPAEDSVE